MPRTIEEASRYHRALTPPPQNLPAPLLQSDKDWAELAGAAHVLENVMSTVGSSKHGGSLNNNPHNNSSNGTLEDVERLLSSVGDESRGPNAAAAAGSYNKNGSGGVVGDPYSGEKDNVSFRSPTVGEEFMELINVYVRFPTKQTTY